MLMRAAACPPSGQLRTCGWVDGLRSCTVHGSHTPPPPHHMCSTPFPVPRLAALPACPAGQCRLTLGADCASEWLGWITARMPSSNIDLCFRSGGQMLGPALGGCRRACAVALINRGPMACLPIRPPPCPPLTHNPDPRPAVPASCPLGQYRPSPSMPSTTCAACTGERLHPGGQLA
jgi:hypothetical protein